MNTRCNTIQDTLATEGPRALADDDEAQQHLAECDACFRFLESLSEVEEGLTSMAQFDVPDEVVDSLLDRPEIAGTTLGDRLRAAFAALMRPRPFVWSSLAAASLIVVVAVGVRFNLPEETSTQGLQGPDTRATVGNKRENAPLEQDPVLREPEAESQRVDGESFRSERKVDQKAPAEFSDEFIGDLPVPGRFYTNVPTQAEESKDTDGGSSTADPLSAQDPGRDNRNSIEEMERITAGAGLDLAQAQGDYAEATEQNKLQSEVAVRESVAKQVSQARKAAPLIGGVAGVTEPVLIEESRVVPDYPELARAARVKARVILQLFLRADGSVASAEALDCDRPEMGFEQAAIDAVLQWRFKPALQGDVAVDAFWTITVDFDLDRESSLLRPDDAVRTARNFLSTRRALDNLTFKSASGYWSNSYVPGDPAMRLLQARLAGWDRSSTEAYLPQTARLHDAARRVGQPFDTPAASALNVFLQADRRGLTEPGRMLVQVGLEGTPRYGGRRPAMNVALVLDLRDAIDDEIAIGVRALLEAFNRAQEPGDSFRLFVAGRPGGCVVQPADFRHGFLKVTLDRLLGAGHHGLDLAAAVSAAIESVVAADDPEAPLGSNAVMLITGRPLGDATQALTALAHQGAVAGAPLSVIGVGGDLALDEIDLVTLAGQGNRRLLDDPASATRLVERELSATSRAIARAVRLRIRLAPGVKLVNVLGSEPLDEMRAQRVRQAERSIDLRLAHKLGIEADRGEDEEGIQIVLPSFYAGDSHAILLDVVAPGTGPIADVTVRYKDLVHLRNGVSRASLSLGRDTEAAGPLERNVLKNLLSIELSETLDRAGLALKQGDAERAVLLLDQFTALLVGLRRELQGFETDPDLLTDIAMLGEYRTLLASGFAAEPEGRDQLVDSLRYAARLKVLPRPLETTS